MTGFLSEAAETATAEGEGCRGPVRNERAA